MSDTGVWSAVHAVDWAAVPGPAGWYEPEEAASGLRKLAVATTLVQVTAAVGRLENGGLCHGHSAAVFPAAAVAAPVLLEIVGHAGPRAKAAALELLESGLRYDPHAGYARIDTAEVARVPVCCAIAEHIRERRDLLTGCGQAGRRLLAEAGAHWRFQVGELFSEANDVMAFGTAGGIVPRDHFPAEVHVADRITASADAIAEYPLDVDTREGVLRLIGMGLDRIRTGAVLYSAECGARVH
ncbi:hypothetical protein [Actinomadura rugatobispora]|uniref:Uncharacterized protein n=1 Tax=Actinomadura rugatobispora TaxID=1994 RepID=A0ABW0ZUP5_9ACTN|nr:hypothetical protein GCM10010200_096060 [Actinomadura rugatobispora]